MAAPARRRRPPAHLLVWSVVLGACPGGSPILWTDMNAPRDVPAPDLQIALSIVDAGDDVPEKKGDIVIVSDDDAPDASDALGPQDASSVADVGVSR